jgi:hypothetical protein
MSAPKLIPKDKRLPYMNKIEEYFKKYYNSPTFARNLEQGASTWWKPSVAEARNHVLQHIANLKVQEDRSVGSAYWPSGNTLTLGSRQKALSSPDNQVYAHEYAHIGEDYILPEQPKHFFSMIDKERLYENLLEDKILGGADKEIAKRNLQIKKKYRDITYNDMVKAWKNKDYSSAKNIAKDYFKDESNSFRHDSSPNEVRADILALRYLMAKNGIWDITDPKSGQFNVEMLNKLYLLPELNRDMIKDGWRTMPTKIKNTRSDVKAPPNPGLFLNRLRERYSDDDIIWLINNIASNKINKSGDNQNAGV